MDVDSLQHQLLSAALPHVPFDGWSARTLERAQQDTKLREIDVLRAFPGGAPDLLAYFMEHLDQLMITALNSLPLNEMKMHEKIEAAIMLRLRAAEPFREAVRKAVAYYALPLHGDATMKRIYTTTDTIWRSVGDHSTDFSFYTKRLSLAAIYSSTLLFWLDDYSDKSDETRAFLQRRLHDLFRFHQLKKRLFNPLSAKTSVS